MSKPFSELDIELKLTTATGCLSPGDREGFLIAIVHELAPGEGALHQAIAKAQRQFLREQPILGDGVGTRARSKYAGGGRFVERRGARHRIA